MHGGVVYKIDLDRSIRIATALALLIAVVLSTQPSRYRSPSSEACCLSPNVNSPSQSRFDTSARGRHGVAH